MSAGERNGGHEAIFRPDWPIVDSHHHFWDGFLRGSGLEVPVPVYSPDDFLADLNTGHKVVATVAVESFSHYGDRGPAGETAFADAAGNAHPGMADAIVGWADLRQGADLAKLLDEHQARSPRLRGIRHSAAWDSDADGNFATLAQYTQQGMLADPAFIAGVRELGRRELVHDVFVLHPQLVDVAHLADAAPDTRIVIDHIGMPLALGRYEGCRDAVMEQWLRGLDALAGCPNVWVKLGGATMAVTQPGREADTSSSHALGDSLRPWFDPVIAAFGPARCLFESNFPVEKATCDYRTLWNAFKKIGAAHGQAAAHALLAGTACALYRFEPSGVSYI